MMARVSIFLFFVLSFFNAAAVSAAEISDLFEARIPVKTQEQRERFAVYPAAISQVIVKISGNTAAPQNPKLATLIANGRRLVQRYHYAPLDEANPLLAEEGYSHTLIVQFDGEALTQTLVQAGVPLWGRTRPEVLVWLAIEDREVRYLLGANASQELESYVTEAAQKRGLPVLLPLMDLEDQINIRFADVWGGFRQAIMDASARYGVENVLVGRLYRAEQGPWQARWTLFQGKDVVHWQASGWTQAAVIGNGIDGAADNIAARFAQLFATDANDRLVLAVNDVADLHAYARVMRYLRSLDAVTDVQPLEVKGDEILFEVAIRTNRHSVVRDIALGHVLAEAASVESVVGQDVAQKLIYTLVP